MCADFSARVRAPPLYGQLLPAKPPWALRPRRRPTRTRPARLSASFYPSPGARAGAGPTAAAGACARRPDTSRFASGARSNSKRGTRDASGCDSAPAQ